MLVEYGQINMKRHKVIFLSIQKMCLSGHIFFIACHTNPLRTTLLFLDGHHSVPPTIPARRVLDHCVDAPAVPHLGVQIGKVGEFVRIGKMENSIIRDMIHHL